MPRDTTEIEVGTGQVKGGTALRNRGAGRRWKEGTGQGSRDRRLGGPEGSLGRSTLQLGSPGLLSQSNIFRVLTCVLGPEHILKNKVEYEAVAGSLLPFRVNFVFSLCAPLSLTLVTPWGREGGCLYPSTLPGQPRWKGISAGGVNWRGGAQEDPPRREGCSGLPGH